jgi:hypothetical protein
MATPFVNKHITRVLAAGGTVAEPTWLATVDAWITSQSLYGNLVDWSNPAFGVIKNGSNHISKIMGLGTTWLPRLGDLTPVAPTSTTYSATGLNSLPCWVNAANTAISYYGAARSSSVRTNNIRRKHFQGLTVAGVYTKSGTAVASLLGYGQFGGFYLQNTSGSPGPCKFSMRPVSGAGTEFSDTHGTTLANATTHIIGGTFDREVVTAYVEGVAGSGSAGSYTATNTGNNQYRPLLGGATLTEMPYTSLYSGSSTSHNTLSTASTVPALDGISNEALFSMSDLIIFDRALTALQMASLNTLLRTRYGP